MKHIRISICILLVLMIQMCSSSLSFADVGPKPSVVLDFVGLEGEIYYVTLLSDVTSTGPHSVLTEEAYSQRVQTDDADFPIWEKFVNYDDQDGFHFLQYFGEATQTHRFVWGYYPPAKFKILLYFPEYDQFVVSEDMYERYAFDSYYKVDGSDLIFNNAPSTQRFDVERNYYFAWELFSLVVRIVATILIEVLVAFIFGFRSKDYLKVIILVNLFTQTVLNLLLNLINYKYGNMMFLFNYLWMEMFIVVIEARLYGRFLIKEHKKQSVKQPIFAFALTANIVSFIIGLYIAYHIPGIF